MEHFLALYALMGYLDLLGLLVYFFLCPYGNILPSPFSLFFLFSLIPFNYLTPSALIFTLFVFSFVNNGDMWRFQYGLKRGGGRHNRSTTTLRVGLRLECFSC
jgi:hypothetical protein